MERVSIGGCSAGQALGLFWFGSGPAESRPLLGVADVRAISCMKRAVFVTIRFGSVRNRPFRAVISKFNLSRKLLLNQSLVYYNRRKLQGFSVFCPLTSRFERVCCACSSRSRKNPGAYQPQPNRARLAVEKGIAVGLVDPRLTPGASVDFRPRLCCCFPKFSRETRARSLSHRNFSVPHIDNRC